VIDIVLNGTFYCSQAVGKHWIESGNKGAILNMTATYAWDAGAGVIHSSAAKAGVLNMTRTLAVEWGSKYGIRVNAIAPGPIERTGGADKLFESEQAAKRTIQSVPLQRLGKPEEIAELAYFLLSDKASYINGEVVTMDGGQWLNKYPFQSRFTVLLNSKPAFLKVLLVNFLLLIVVFDVNCGIGAGFCSAADCCFPRARIQPPCPGKGYAGVVRKERF